MNAVLLATIWIVVLSTHARPLTAGQSTGNEPLYVLSLLPYSDSNGKYGWDKGLELLPAARVAVRHINSRADILPGYELVLVERASDACAQRFLRKGLLNFVGNTLLQNNDDDADAIAVVGLACSSVTATVSPIAGRFDILQMAMANSVFLRDKVRYPHLWRFVTSSDQLVEAAVSLMNVTGWNRFGMISADSGYFFRALAESFRELVKVKNFTLLFDEAITSNFSTVSLDAIVERIHSMKSRVIVSATTLPESIQLMCQAARKNLLWPGYVWIFLSRSYQDFLDNSHLCSDFELAEILENVLLLDLELSGRDDNVTMVSGLTYAQYRSDYDDEYSIVQREYNGTGVEFSSSYNVYANAMYDELWGLALALNRSLDELNDNNLDLSTYRFNMPEITEIVERNLRSLRFAGAFTDVYFNEYNEVSFGVNLFQIKNGTSVNIMVFNDQQVIKLKFQPDEFPKDDFETRYDFMNTGIVIELYFNAFVLFILTTMLLCVSLWLRKEPELLAVSPLLNSLVFIGCYQLIIASVLSATQNFVELSPNVYVTICYLQSWSGQNGIYFIASTVLVRLIRVYRIFTHFGKTSRFWRDKYLFTVILFISCFPDVVTLVGFRFDPLRYMVDEQYKYNENPPVYILKPNCRSRNGFSTISGIFDQIYTAGLGILLLAFAILTRKVNKKNFKDTKKVTAFVIFFTFIAAMSYIIMYIFERINRDNIAFTIRSYSYQIMILLTLMLLIAPKALPALYYRLGKKKKKRFHELTEKNATISKVLATSLHSVYGGSSFNLSNLVNSKISPDTTTPHLNVNNDNSVGKRNS